MESQPAEPASSEPAPAPAPASSEPASATSAPVPTEQAEPTELQPLGGTAAAGAKPARRRRQWADAAPAPAAAKRSRWEEPKPEPRRSRWERSAEPPAPVDPRQERVDAITAMLETASEEEKPALLLARAEFVKQMVSIRLGGSGETASQPSEVKVLLRDDMLPNGLQAVVGLVIGATHAPREQPARAARTRAERSARAHATARDARRCECEGDACPVASPACPVASRLPDVRLACREAGTRGITQKLLEAEAGCRIAVRGKGSSRTKMLFGGDDEEQQPRRGILSSVRR